MIASVDDRLRAMLEGESKAYLQKGAAFLDLPSSHDCFPRASRLDHLVAHVCNVGVRAVQSCHRRWPGAGSISGRSMDFGFRALRSSLSSSICPELPYVLS